MPRRIVTDFEAIKTHPHITTATLDDETLSIFFDNGQSFSVTVCDYPHGTSFWYCDQTKASGTVEGNMEQIYKTLLKESGAENQQQQNINSNSGETALDDDDANAHQQHNSTMMGTPSKTTDSSQTYSGGGEMSAEQSAMYTYESEDYGMSSQGTLPAEFIRDIDIANRVFGYKTTHERIAEGVRVNVQFLLSDLVADSTAMAWGFSRNTPFNIRFSFERPEYLRCSKPPTTLVTQNGQPCRFGQQIHTALDLYIKNHWNKDGWQPPKLIGDGVEGGGGLEGLTIKKSSRASTSTTGTGNLEKLLNLLTPPQKEMCDQLVKMGFPQDRAAPAARQASSIENAVELCTNGTFLAEDHQVVEAKSWFDSLKEKAGFSTATTEDGAEESIKISAAEIAAMMDTDPSLIADTNKYVPWNPNTDGWFVHLIKYIRKRTPLAHQYCCICDQKHLLGAGMLKVAVCERELCTYRFQELGIGRDATDAVATGGGVIDLLVAFFRMAVEHERRELILEPYPQVNDPVSKKLVLDPKHKDFKELRRLTALLPETRELVGVENIDHLSAKLVSKDKYLLPLLEWIISSNRCLIVKLRTDQIMKRMGTPHQFLLVSAAPEKQAKFDALKAKYGSIFGFHGSRVENWHCIFRNGLRNYSNKNGYMLAGAALGAGIYVALDASTSLGYSQAHGLGQGTKITRNGKEESYFDGSKAGSFACMALVEIAKDPSGYKDHGNVKTVQNEDCIITRFFFVFTTQEQVAKAQGASTSNSEFDKELRNLVANT